MQKKIRIGARPSNLALKQAGQAIKLLRKAYPEAAFSIRKIYTTGDRDKITPLSDVDGSDFFTREIDEALLAGEIDVGVHSSKDLPEILPEELVVAVETESISHYDALVSRGNIKFGELPADSRIGASSARRKNDIKALREDLAIIDVRGNIEERLALIDSGKIDALIVAEAALIRLNLEHRITEVLSLEFFKTHPKQGRISLVVKKGSGFEWQKVKYLS